MVSSQGAVSDASVSGRTCGKGARHTAQLGTKLSTQMVAVLEAANASTASDAAVFMVTAGV